MVIIKKKTKTLTDTHKTNKTSIHVNKDKIEFYILKLIIMFLVF